nr:restriction endonuclease subunit S [Treponema sp.]
MDYELPVGWKWCKQNEVCRLTDGEKKTDVSYPYLEVKYLRGNKEKDFVTSGKFIKAGTKVILVDGENSGEVFTVPEDGYMGSTFKALSIQNVDEKYLQFFIQTKKDLYRNNKKGSAIPHLNKDLFFNMPFPLPPTLTEQQRIVSRIESLFTKLDEAKDKAQSVVDGFELRRAAVLHKAFTGELTAKWRKDTVSDDSWEEKTIGECCTVVRGGSPRPAGDPKYYDGTIPFMKVADITGNDSKYVCSTQFTIKEAGLHKTRMVEPDTLLLTNSGATLGVPAITKIKTTFNDGIAAFLNLPKESNLYFYYFFTSKTTELRAINMGAAQPNLNIDIIKSITIPVPTLAEQQEIVRILDTVLEKETRAKEATQTVLDQIALLKKSILARAFRGEL